MADTDYAHTKPPQAGEEEFKQVFRMLYGAEVGQPGRPSTREYLGQLGHVATGVLVGRGGVGAITGGPKNPEYFHAALKRIVAENAEYDAIYLIKQTLKAAKSWGHKLDQFEATVPKALWPGKAP